MTLLILDFPPKEYVAVNYLFLGSTLDKIKKSQGNLFWDIFTQILYSLEVWTAESM